MDFIICVLGTVMFVEGIPYASSPAMVKQVMQKVLEMPDSAIRKIGFCLMIAGIITVYLGKN